MITFDQAALLSAQVEAVMAQYGPNELPKAGKRSILRIVLPALRRPCFGAAATG
jgi:hypothetical protein